MTVSAVRSVTPSRTNVLKPGSVAEILDRARLDPLDGEDAGVVGRPFVGHVGVGVQHRDGDAGNHAALSVADGAGDRRTRLLCECAGREAGQRAQR